MIVHGTFALNHIRLASCSKYLCNLELQLHDSRTNGGGVINCSSRCSPHACWKCVLTGQANVEPVSLRTLMEAETGTVDFKNLTDGGGTNIGDVLMCMHANGGRRGEKGLHRVCKGFDGRHKANSPFRVAPSAGRIPFFASFEDLQRAQADPGGGFLGKLCSNIASDHRGRRRRVPNLLLLLPSNLFRQRIFCAVAPPKVQE